MQFTTPTTSTTTFSGYAGSNGFSGSATTFGTKTTSVPITVDRYNQDGMFLRNAHNVNSLWTKHKQDYTKTGKSDFDGIWKNENYELELYQSGNEIAGFIHKVVGRDVQWNTSDLKLIFNPLKGTGIYMMGDKKPVPSKIYINRFGHLDITLLTSKEHIAFKRIQAKN
jgi:hypothetical protein